MKYPSWVGPPKGNRCRGDRANHVALRSRDFTERSHYTDHGCTQLQDNNPVYVITLFSSLTIQNVACSSLTVYAVFGVTTFGGAFAFEISE